MKKLIFLFAIVFLINGCSKDDSQTTKDQQEQIIDGGTIKRFELVTISLDDLAQNNYQGNINGNSIELMKTDNNSLTFFIGENITVGENILEINTLNKKVRYTVEETVLENTLQNTLDQLSVNFNNYANGLTNNTPQEINVTSVINNFNTTLNQLEENQRETIAKVYLANKVFFDNLYQTDYTVPQGKNMMSDYSNLSNRQLVVNFAGSTVGAGVATAGAILSLASANLFITLPFAVAAYPLWQISSDLFDEIIFNRLWVYTQLKWDNVVSSITNNNRTMMSNLEFQNGQEKTINFELDARGFSNSDNSNTNEVFSKFFSSFNNFNSIISDLNNVINFVNDIPLINFGLVDNVTIGNPTQNTIDATQSLFSNFTFSINDSNLELGNPTFSNGNLNLTISIINETNVTDFVESTINYSYSDENASFTGNFPIKVFKENSIDLSGIWSLQKQSNTCDNQQTQFLSHYGANIEFNFNNDNTLTFLNSSDNINDNLSQNNYSIQNNSLTINLNWNGTELAFTGNYEVNNDMFSGTFNEGTCSVPMNITK